MSNYEKKASNLEEYTPLGWVRERVYINHEIGYRKRVELTEKDKLLRAEFLEDKERARSKAARKRLKDDAASLA